MHLPCIAINVFERKIQMKKLTLTIAHKKYRVIIEDVDLFAECMVCNGLIRVSKLTLV